MFSQGTIERLRHYVYRLVDPKTNVTFYVGKGIGNRAYQHIEEARAGGSGDKCERIREIIGASHAPVVIVHRHGMDAATAIEVEAALIEAYRLTELVNVVSGHGIERGAELASELEGVFGLPAEITTSAILLKIDQQWEPGLSAAQIYARTRRYWNANPETRQSPPTHAFTVARGLIREVYRIQKWETFRADHMPDDPDRLPGFDERAPIGRLLRGFVGEPDPEFAHLRNRSVQRHFTNRRDFFVYVTPLPSRP